MGALAIRRALLVVVAASALVAVLAGLARVGVPLGFGPRFAGAHGPLFAVGVFGTVIALERAVALSRAAALAAPVAAVLAAVAMLAGLSFAPWLSCVSAALLVVVNAVIVRRQSASFTWLMLLGAAVLLAGNLGWALARPIVDVVLPWVGFFVLTIVSERLELSRLAPTPRWASRLLVVVALASAAFAVARVFGGEMWTRAFGVTLALLGTWQLAFDLARRTVKQRALPRFAAVGVLAGALWLVVAGVMFAAWRVPPAGPRYDAVLHALFVGYVLSMVFAHAPIILPAVARVALPFSALLYAPLALLHASVVLRIAGDVVDNVALRRFGALGNALSLAVFAAAVVIARLKKPGR